MKTLKLMLNLALLATLSVSAADSTLHYALAGEMHLTMQQEIFVGGHKDAIGTRDISMAFNLGGDESSDDLLIELAAIKANYSAHGMTQRLPTSHLVGKTFRLTSDSRTFESQKSDGEVPLGTITDGGLKPSELLAGLLPTLPGGPVSIGTSWVTDRTIRSLEGWAWADGNMRRHHEVTDVRQSNGRTVIHVKSLGETTIAAAAGHDGFLGKGTLTEHSNWSFDSGSGQLLTLAVERESNGTNKLPQGEIPLRQTARYELHN